MGRRPSTAVTLNANAGLRKLLAASMPFVSPAWEGVLRNDLRDIEIPEQLRAAAARHKEHVAQLVGQLRSFGMTEEAIEQSVDQLISAYRAELVEAIKALGEATNA
jgi:hypothetical protein